MNECLLNRDPQWPSHCSHQIFSLEIPDSRNACMQTCPLKKNTDASPPSIFFNILLISNSPPLPSRSLQPARAAATCICPSLTKAPALNEILHKTNHNNGTTDGEFAAVVVQHYQQQQQQHQQQPHRRHVFATFSARDDRRSWMGYHRVSAQPRGR